MNIFKKLLILLGIKKKEEEIIKNEKVVSDSGNESNMIDFEKMQKIIDEKTKSSNELKPEDNKDVNMIPIDQIKVKKQKATPKKRTPKKEQPKKKTTKKSNEK